MNYETKLAVKLWEKETEEGWEGAVGMLVREGGGGAGGVLCGASAFNE